MAKLKKKLARSYEDLKDKLEDAKERLQDLEEDFEENVADHPIRALAISFGVGILVGTLLMARRRK